MKERMVLISPFSFFVGIAIGETVLTFQGQSFWYPMTIGAYLFFALGYIIFEAARIKNQLIMMIPEMPQDGRVGSVIRVFLISMLVTAVTAPLWPMLEARCNWHGNSIFRTRQ